MTNVVMPQMGESIAEGTIVRWIKKVGDPIDRDEPLFEISTDKVDAEIPSPAAGVLTEIKVKEGETVPVNSVVATIGAQGDAAAPVEENQTELPAATAGQEETESGGSASTAPTPRTADVQPPRSEGLKAGTTGDTGADLRRQKSSPLVRRIARDNQIDIGFIKGTGLSGRVTKQDILGYIESAHAPGAAAPQRGEQAHAGPVYKPGERVQVVPMSIMRRK